MKEQVRSIAAAGNAAALVLLILILANRTVLFESEAPLSREAGEGRGGGPTLLILLDGLRLDRSLDPRLMPNLVRLGREGGRGVARVEALIPSTVAGIRTLAEGIVPPPASFFGDFGTTRSPTGGIFAEARKAGLATFVAGPRLWSDLYGPWLTGSLSIETVSGRDGEVLRAGLAALRSGRYPFTVIHFNGPDDAAHLSGAHSEEYERSLADCDAALGRLIEAAAPNTRIVVTADHGVADPGGHAGPEEDVVAVPLVVRGFQGNLGEIRQRDVHHLLLAPLPRTDPPSPSRPVAVPIAAFAMAAAMGAVLLKRSESPRAATWLNAALWITLAAAVAGFPVPSLLIAFGALTAAVLPFRLSRPAALCLGTTGLSLAVGLLRLLDGRAPIPETWKLAGALAAGFLLGFLCGKLKSPLLAGALAAALPALVAALAGETASLSTLDVRAAFRIVDGPLGLTGAATVAALRQALPSFSVVLGLASFLKRCDQERTAAFAAGLLTSLSGQAAAAALVLLLAEDFALASRSIGLLVRLVGEMSALFLGCALVIFCHDRSTSPNHDRS